MHNVHRTTQTQQGNITTCVPSVSARAGCTVLPAPRTRPAHAEAQPLPLARCASVMAVDLAQPSRPLRVPIAHDRVRASLRENNHFYDDSSHSAQPAPWPRHPSMPAEQRLLERAGLVSCAAPLADFLAPKWLVMTARVCVALRGTLATCVTRGVIRLVPPLRRRAPLRLWGCCYKIVLQGFRPTEDAYVWELWPEHHKRHFYTKRQCLIHVHAMRKSPARSCNIRIGSRCECLVQKKGPPQK